MSSALRLPSTLAAAIQSDQPEKLTQAWEALPAAQRPDVEILSQYVIEQGASLTPAVAEWFVNQGIRLDQVKEAPGRGCFDWLSQAMEKGNQPLVAWLADVQGLANRRLPSGGPTPLMEALLDENWGAAETLLANGAQINALTLHGQTALHQAAQGYQMQAMIWLMEHGADPTLEDSFHHLASELIPQDTGKEWRPDDTYAWLTGAEEAEPAQRLVIPSAIKDEALVEKIGLTFTASPPDEWDAEQIRVSEVLIERGILPPPQDRNANRPPRVR